uniref:ABC-type uncharacterized transport system, permease component n=1 Tax=Candidatus Kentrum sp. MB TaxID=2138164 RepID=A0A451B9K5_9GAMM|nr:MAG: ABC-type uncharacterized transport system, permease component [Candidatus Kentron sp. MB]VFK29857.1 MAG: ABC-type uncharacterized transport system, permease component [Candidatus Kentron sp. MB]VFK74970.1 MAG: ABC-type uncharacterized transport system, permease component [Candidatus Kentron sp. MB]
MFLSLASILFYLVATALLGFRLSSVSLSRSNGIQVGLFGSSILGAALHGAALYELTLTSSGFNLGFFPAMSLISWGIVLVLLMGAMVRPLENLGILVLPLAAMTVAMALVYPGRHMLPEGMGLGVKIHIVLSILAASVLAIAAFQSVFLAFQERSLRRKRLRKIFGIFPPLRTQESILFQLIGVGFFLLSLSLVSGMTFLNDMFVQHLAHKTVLSVFAWVVFAGLLWGRWRYGWRGRRIIRWSLMGFVTLMLAYFGSKLVLEIILGRAWY